jgi:hypothetical protein
MKLTEEQSQRLLRGRGIWITEACNQCRQLLGSIRWTRRGEPGEWCSIACRDGIEAGVSKSNSKGCLECGTRLDGKRVDAKFCSRTHMMRYRRCKLSKPRGKRQITGNTPIVKEGLTHAQNGGSTNTIIPALSSYKRLKARSADSQNFTLSTSKGFNKIRN